MLKSLKISDSVALGLHACILIGSSNEKVIQAREISKFLNVSYDHLSKVLQRLVRHGILKSSKGKGGGFLLAVSADKLTLKKIYESIEGPLSFDHCLLGKPKCPTKKCVFGGLINKINNIVFDFFAKTKLIDLIKESKMKRKIIEIDKDKCNGCGICVKACHEGAIQIINGKAELVSEIYCDGLGACIGECAKGAITIVERDAKPFDDKAVEKHLSEMKNTHHNQEKHQCPGMRVMSFDKKTKTSKEDSTDQIISEESELSQWPIQLRLVPVSAPYWNEADLLVCADCVPFALNNFHKRLLSGKKIANACPKLDDSSGYTEKLAEIFRTNHIKSVTVARMEVPCCGGLEMITRQAIKSSGKNIPMKTLIVGIKGKLTMEK